MAEEEESLPAMSTPKNGERPQMARKLPGSFGFDDVDDLSPDKEEYDDSLFAHANAKAHQENQRVPSLDPTSLPSLPPPTDSSLLYSQSASGSDAHEATFDEKELQRHLNDVDSSFLAAPEPLGIEDSKGVDDTYLFDAAQFRTTNITFRKKDTSPETHRSNTPPSPPANAYKTPAVGSEENTDEDIGNTTSSLEQMSSPTAAAAARTVSRALSIASGQGQEQEAESSDTSAQSVQEPSEVDAEHEMTPRKPKKPKLDLSIDSSEDTHTLRHRLSTQSLGDFVTDAGSTPGAALLNRKSSGKRPKYLENRHSSRHSSISSLATNLESQDGSDITIGADYGVLSGGAVPAAGSSRMPKVLSRSISLGSMASGIEDISAENLGRAPDASLATLTEEEQNRERKGTDDVSPPETPRAKPSSRSMPAPTDTIIARHVRNVQVPESLAKEYRSKSGVPDSPSKRSGFTVSTVGRSGKNLTLKEQSSTIERLSKENFDLKLKVMFLSDRLDKLSEEGVKELVSENVDLRTINATWQRDNRNLKKRLRELEKQLKDDEERPGTATSGTTSGDHSSPRWFDQEGAQEREEELVYLRERVEEYVTEIEKLRNEGLAREKEKHNLTELIRNMGDRRGQDVDAREEMDVWKDLLEQETARREQADEDNRKLREEIFRLKTEPTSTPGLNHTTNIYNITKKRQASPSRPRSELSDRTEDRNGTFSAASTLVEELRRDCDHLRHENAELKREVGAQTSMLTSRNREKELLYQEIEDLKLAQRRGVAGSIAGESIFERSASRTHQRSLSRGSAATRQTDFEDAERENLENKQAELRDRINSLKIHNQELQRELESCMEDFETAVEQKKTAETLANELQEALEVAESDLLTIQAERDEALHGQDEAEQAFEALRKEAQEELDSYATEADAAAADIERLQNDLADSTENFNALQNEMREMSESVVRLEDSHDTKSRRINDLERELEDANRELEQLEKNLQESNDKVSHLTVQRESSQSEIAFLREEQDGDKIKIADLETNVKKLEQSLQEEKDHVKELEQRIRTERHQREIIAGKKQNEVEKQFNQMNRENSGLRDECQRLKTKLTAAAGDAAANAQKVLELETGLKQALGDLHGTKSSLVGSVNKLTSTLNETVRDVNNLKRVLGEKDRSIKNKDEQLESQALELRRLADIAERERQAHRNTSHQFETFQKTTHHTSRTLTQQETRVVELEGSRQHDRKKIAQLENQLRDQMTERGNLLLTIWSRLSALCGAEWAHNNSLINGRALPSLEAISNMLPGFSKNLLAAVKNIETMMGDFQTRISNVEKTLWKEYQTLETNLDVRTKRLDRLETMVRASVPGAPNNEGRAEISKLREINKTLKSEISSLRAADDVRSKAFLDGAASPGVPMGPRTKTSEKTRTTTLTRATTSSAVEQYDRGLKSRSGTMTTLGSNERSPTKTVTPDDIKYQLRLQEMEYRLRGEREGRLDDRGNAQGRIKKLNEQIKELQDEVGRYRQGSSSRS